MVQVPEYPGLLSSGLFGIGHLFSQVRDAVAVIDATDGGIVLWNPAAERILGYGAAEALDMSGSALGQVFCTDASPPNGCAWCSPDLADQSVFEAPVRKKDGTQITVEVSLTPFEDGVTARPLVLAIMHDITDRKRSEAALRYQKTLLESQSEASIDGILIISNEGKILSHNRRFVEMWGIPPDVMETGSDEVALNWAVDQLVDPDEFLTRVAYLYLHADEESHEDIWLKDGRIFDRFSAPVRNADGEHFGRVWYFRDATESRQLHEQAQQAAVLEERQRLARDLHDAVTQTLFSASLIAEVVPRLWERNREEGLRRLAELRQLTRGALAEMRALLLELRPEALTEVGLDDLLQQLADAFVGRTRVAISLTIDGRLALPPDAQIALYRIAQESLNNVAKHANATQVMVNLRCNPDVLELRVRDDGRGFDPTLARPGHLGMVTMRERAEGIGATLDINSTPGAGTEIVVRVPDVTSRAGFIVEDVAAEPPAVELTEEVR